MKHESERQCFLQQSYDDVNGAYDADFDAKYLFEETAETTESTSAQGATHPPEETPCHKYILGMLVALSVVVCTSISAMCAQTLGGFIPEFELNMWRFITQFFVVLPVVLIKQINVMPKKEHVPWIMATCFCYNAYNVFYYTASIHLPIGTIGGISPSFILIIVAVVTVVTSKECTFTLAISVVLCVTGTVLISQPRFIFKNLIDYSNITNVYHLLCQKGSSLETGNNTSHNDHHGEDNVVVFNELLGYIFTIFSSILVSIGYFIANKKLNMVHPFHVLFWVALSGTVVSLALSAIMEDFTFVHTASCVALLAGHSLGAALGTAGVQISLQIISPVSLSLVQSLQVVFLCIAQYTVMSRVNPGKQNAVEIAGTVTIFIGNIVTPLYKLFIELYHRRFKSRDNML